MLRRVGREALAIRMIGLFVESAPTRATAIRDGHRDGDLDAVRRAAHSLRPSAGQLGASGLQSLCQEIEDAAAAGDRDAIGALLPQFDGEVTAALEWLAGLLPHPAPQPDR